MSLYFFNNYNNYRSGNWVWASGPTQSITLQQGTVIQRIGGAEGRFVSPHYTDPMSLSLPYHQMPNMSNPTMYIVKQPITVIVGKAAPWFGQYGGGTQYILPKTIQQLINSGILSILGGK